MQSWERSGIWDQIHHLLLTMLRQENKLHLETAIVDTTQVRAFGGGDASGPSPVDRRKKGTKYTLLVDRDGVPLVIRAVAANRSDHLEILPTVVYFPTVGGKPGRPLTHPKKLYADAGLIAKRLEVFFAGWVSSRTFGTAMTNTAVTSVACVGWWKEPSVGSKVCDACAFATIGRALRSTDGRPSRRQSFVFIF